MDIQPLLMLTNEAHTALALLLQATERGQGDCVTGISECNRRASSALADFHAQQFRAFVPPLPRAPAAAAAEALHSLVGAIFSAALLLPRSADVGAHRREELRGLSRMSALLCETANMLPRFARGKQPPAPDTFRFYAEQNKVRASHALSVLHGERSLWDRAADESLGMLAHAMDEAHRALLVLMLESV
jgi:hypothetical protein